MQFDSSICFVCARIPISCQNSFLGLRNAQPRYVALPGKISYTCNWWSGLMLVNLFLISDAAHTNLNIIPDFPLDYLQSVTDRFAALMCLRSLSGRREVHC